MQKILCFALVLLTAASLLACGAPQPTETETDATRVVDTFPYPQIKEKLTWEAINAIPVKSADMTEDELRQLCIDFFLFAKTALWMPNSEWKYTMSDAGTPDEMAKGQIYGGLPYYGNGSGNVYRLMDFINEETGVVDMAWGMENPKLFGNQCGNSAGWGWARVVNSAQYGYTFQMVQGNGFLRVGPYVYDDTLVRFKEGICSTEDVIKANGPEIIFRSYAAMKKADGLVTYTSAGHVMMACADPVVVYGDDGAIDPSQSYVHIHDQHAAWVEDTNDTGDTYLHKNHINKKFTFAQLLQAHYIPFTFAEFQGTDPVEDTECSFSHTGDTITAAQLNAGEVTANYSISDIYAIVRDAEGKEQYRIVKRAEIVGVEALNFNRLVTSSQLEPYADGNHTVDIVCQLGTGERLTVYTGTLGK